MRFVIFLASLFYIISMDAKDKLDGAYLQEITTDYKTPHLKWTSGEHAKPLRAFFIVCRVGGRDVAELVQRLDIDYTALTVARAGIFAIEDTYESAVEGTSLRRRTRRAY